MLRLSSSAFSHTVAQNNVTEAYHLIISYKLHQFIYSPKIISENKRLVEDICESIHINQSNIFKLKFTFLPSP
jgi:hypothetical protein